MKKILLIFIMLIGFTGIALAHSGKTNSQGCHMDHSTGIYHCH